MLRSDHASPVRDACLPYDSEHKQTRNGVLGLYSSLRSRLTAHNGSDAYASLAPLTLTPGPMVEATVQLRIY